jgi:ATP-dependent RNA helicase RhlB
MPIKLIRALAARLKKSEPSEMEARSSTRSRSKDTSKHPALAAKPGEVWRPGAAGSSKADTKPVIAEEGRRTRGPVPRRHAEATKPSEAGSVPKAGSAVRSVGQPEEAGDPERKKRRRSRGGRGRKRTDAGHAEALPDSQVAQTPVAVDSPKPEVLPPWSLSDYVVEPKEGKTRFLDVDLPETILHGLSDIGFQYCTPVQARVLTEVSQGHNVAGKAQTGTGKTAAFLLLTFKQFLQNPIEGERPVGRPRALVLAPTRELVIQIVRDADGIGKYCNMRYLALYGGTDYDRQERQLREAPIDLIAATPGRLLDFCRKGVINLKDVEVLVIDEADRMLDMGFIPDVKTIIRQTPPKERRRTLLFSATLSDDVMRLAAQWMPDPHVVEIEPEQVAVDTVKQLVYMVRAEEKFRVLYNLLIRPGIGRVLIFSNRRDQADRIAGELKRYGVDCALLSGAVDQNKRMKVLEAFRAGTVQVVVATDVAGRGLHVDGINHVVNFDLPYEAEDYVHRIGRTGRAGAEGTAVSFACEDESFGIPEIEKYIGEELACKYPEDVLLRALPQTDAPAYQRPPRTGGGGGARSGRSGPGGRSGGRMGGGRRPPRR